jgi:hypothetical protein
VAKVESKREVVKRYGLQDGERELEAEAQRELRPAINLDKAESVRDLVLGLQVEDLLDLGRVDHGGSIHRIRASPRDR